MLFKCDVLVIYVKSCFRWSTLKLVSAVTAGLCGVCFVVKTSNQLLNRLLVQRFDEIFKVINEVDLAIKRARDYLGEIKVLKSGTQNDKYTFSLK